MAPLKRVALDVRMTRQMSVGMKTYVKELSARLPRVAPDLEFVRFATGANFGWEEQIALPLRLKRARVDLTHHLSLYGPVLSPRPFVITIHDLIHLRFPQYFKSKIGPYYRTVVRSLCVRAARVITDDERTTDDLERFLGVKRKNVRVIPLGVEDPYLREASPFRAERPYLLYVGNHRAHKDLPTLFEAWKDLDRDVDLYLTGPDDFGGTLDAYELPDRRITVLGDVSEEALAGYYAGAVALVHPALCEGFGLPMLEAMASGCAVVACEDAVPGVLRSATRTFPARDAAALLAELRRIVDGDTVRAALAERGRTLARSLTWDRCAAATAEVYREVLEEQGS